MTPTTSYPTRRSLREAREADVSSVDTSRGVVAHPSEAVAVPSAVRPVAHPTRRSLRESAAAPVPAQTMTTPTMTTPAMTTPAMAPVASVPPSAAPASAAPKPAAPIPAAPIPAASIPAAPIVTAVGIHSTDIDTNGAGFAPVVSPQSLDWLGVAANQSHEDSEDSSRVPVKQWIADVRSGIAGVDVRSAAVRLLPQAGVVAVMAAATFGNAVAGEFAPSGVVGTASSIDLARQQTLILPGSSGAPVASDLDGATDLVAGEDGMLRVRAAEDASRGGTRDALPSCDGVPPEVAIANGDIPAEYLCQMPDGRNRLRADAAEAFALLNEAFRAHYGTDICVTSGYRTYAEQAALRRQKPGLAAAAGTSQHGYGLAVDMCGGVETAGDPYWWLRENAPAFGFDNPTWARKGGSKYEPWHWEYVNGQW